MHFLSILLSFNNDSNLDLSRILYSFFYYGIYKLSSKTTKLLSSEIRLGPFPSLVIKQELARQLTSPYIFISNNIIYLAPAHLSHQNTIYAQNHLPAQKPLYPR
jgi:hypothetical protein